MTDWWHKARPSTPDPVRSTGKTYGTDGDVTVEATHWPDGTATLRTARPADTPDPSPAPIAENFAGHGSHRPGTVCLACEAVRPVSPPSELAAEEIAIRQLEACPCRDHLQPLSVLRATLDAARAAPQADANLEGYWERAYWEIVPKLAAALDAAPQADAGTLREHEPGEPHHYGRLVCDVCGQQGTIRLSIEPLDAAPQADAETLGSSIATAVRRVSNREEFNHLHIDWTALGAALVEEWPALAASPATAGREE